MPLLRVPYKMLSAPVPPFKLTSANAALLLMDAQHYACTRTRGLGLAATERGIDREFDEYYRQVDAALNNMARLAKACRSHGVRVIYSVLNGAKADGGDLSRQMRVSELPVPSGDPRAEIRPEVAPQAGERILLRVTYSPFVETELLRLLRDTGVDTLIVAGMMANYTVWQTAREAADRDFGVVVVSDASASETLEWHQQLLNGLVGGLIRQRSTSDMIEMLEGTRT
jgi:nicotinamidase-related amidase